MLRVSVSSRLPLLASQLPPRQYSPTSPSTSRVQSRVRQTSQSLAVLALASTTHPSRHETALPRASSRTLRSSPLANRLPSRCPRLHSADKELIRTRTSRISSFRRSLVASSWWSQSRTACAHSSAAWTTSTTQRPLPLAVLTTGQMTQAHGLLVERTSRSTSTTPMFRSQPPSRLCDQWSTMLPLGQHLKSAMLHSCASDSISDGGMLTKWTCSTSTLHSSRNSTVIRRLRSIGIQLPSCQRLPSLSDQRTSTLGLATATSTA